VQNTDNGLDGEYQSFALKILGRSFPGCVQDYVID